MGQSWDAVRWKSRALDAYMTWLSARRQRVQRSVTEIEVERRRQREQSSPPDAPVARICPECEQPDADPEAHSGDCATMGLGVGVQTFHARRPFYARHAGYVPPY